MFHHVMTLSSHDGQKLLPKEQVTSVVDALDHRRVRFSNMSFFIIFLILRISEPCWAQIRGLWLLIVRIQRAHMYVAYCSQTSLPSAGRLVLSTSTGQPKPKQLERKARLESRRRELGQEILPLSFASFCNLDENSKERRWVRGRLSRKFVDTKFCLDGAPDP